MMSRKAKASDIMTPKMVVEQSRSNRVRVSTRAAYRSVAPPWDPDKLVQSWASLIRTSCIKSTPRVTFLAMNTHYEAPPMQKGIDLQLITIHETSYELAIEPPSHTSLEIKVSGPERSPGDPHCVGRSSRVPRRNASSDRRSKGSPRA